MDRQTGSGCLTGQHLKDRRKEGRRWTVETGRDWTEGGTATGTASLSLSLSPLTLISHLSSLISHHLTLTWFDGQDNKYLFFPCIPSFFSLPLPFPSPSRSLDTFQDFFDGGVTKVGWLGKTRRQLCPARDSSPLYLSVDLSHGVLCYETGSLVDRDIGSGGGGGMAADSMACSCLVLPLWRRPMDWPAAGSPRQPFLKRQKQPLAVSGSVALKGPALCLPCLGLGWASARHMPPFALPLCLPAPPGMLPTSLSLSSFLLHALGGQVQHGPHTRGRHAGPGLW